MKVLVAYASKAGSTKGEAGVSADVCDVSSVQRPEDYDAFVV